MADLKEALWDKARLEQLIADAVKEFESEHDGALYCDDVQLVREPRPHEQSVASLMAVEVHVSLRSIVFEEGERAMTEQEPELEAEGSPS